MAKYELKRLNIKSEEVSESIEAEYLRLDQEWVYFFNDSNNTIGSVVFAIPSSQIVSIQKVASEKE